MNNGNNYNEFNDGLFLEQQPETIVKALKNKKVSIVTATILILIFIYFQTKLKNAPVSSSSPLINCDPTFKGNVERSFIHIDPSHLLSNLFGLWVLSASESNSSSLEFGAVAASILGLSSVGMTIAQRSFPKKINCAIGFSGVLFGLLSYTLIRQYQNGKKKNGNSNLGLVLSALLVNLLVPSVTTRNVSFAGHLIGALSGLLVTGISPLFLKANKK